MSHFGIDPKLAAAYFAKQIPAKKLQVKIILIKS